MANSTDLTVSIPKPSSFVLTFTDLSYTIKTPTKFSLFPHKHNSMQHTRKLLDSVSGEARDGEIMAVLGASGSGKSTLIDALANRIVPESLHGSVLLNGEPVDSRMLKIISAYVMQDDLLFPMLTVEETLMYSAEFRLPRSLSRDKKRSRVHTLMEQLGLTAVAKTVIGDEGHRGVSGGERRRVSIGIDIVHDPIVLFLDEPTSGLDSTSAFMVVNVLKRIALSGSIVVMSVHQPSYRILGLLDQLLFLSHGQTVFFGSPENLSTFFTDFGNPIPNNENPAEFVLDLILTLNSTPSAIQSLVNFNNSRPQTSNPPTMSFHTALATSISTGKLVYNTTNNSTVSSVPKFANNFMNEVFVLTKRSFVNSRRAPELFITRLIATLVTSFILGTSFWHLDDTPKGVKERLGFFAFAMTCMFYTCADALPLFIQERYIFMRETAYNAYRLSSYVVSNAIVSFPPYVLLCLAFAFITFFAIGLYGGHQGFTFYLLIILASFWAGSGFVTFVSGVVSQVILGYTIVVAVLAYYLLFSGFFIIRDRIPSYWIWFHYVSLVKYPYEGVLLNEFRDSGKCFMRGVQVLDGTPMANLNMSAKMSVLKAMSTSTGLNFTVDTCFMTGNDVLAQQSITELSKWNCLVVTVAWGFFFRVLFYVSLLLGSKNKRR